MQRGEVYAILVIPKGLEHDASSGRQPTLDYYTNNSFLIAGSLLYRGPADDVGTGLRELPSCKWDRPGERPMPR